RRLDPVDGAPDPAKDLAPGRNARGGDAGGGAIEILVAGEQEAGETMEGFLEPEVRRRSGGYRRADRGERAFDGWLAVPDRLEKFRLRRLPLPPLQQTAVRRHA